MPVLQEINESYGYLPRPSWSIWPRAGGCALAEILRVASFYDRFRPGAGRAGTWSRSARARRATPAARSALLERLEKEIGVGGRRDRQVGTVHPADRPLPRPLCPVAGHEDRRPELRPREPRPRAGNPGAIRMSQPIRNAARPRPAAAAGQATLYPKRLKILVGSASCGVAVGARAVEAAARRAVEELGLDAVVCRTGCIGFCAQEPLLDLVLPNGPRVSYGNMTPEKTRALLPAYARANLKPRVGPGPLHERGDRLDRRDAHLSALSAAASARARVVDPRFLSPPEEGHPAQLRLDRSRCRLDETIARGTYRGAFRALTQMTPDAGDRRGDPLRAARPRRRGLSHRAEVATGPAGRGRREVRGLQRRRRRARRLHGPHRAGRRSARRARRDAHRLLRHRRQRGIHLRPQRVSAGHRDPRTRHRRGREARPVGRRTFSAAAGRSASRSAAGRGPTSAARRRP